MIKSYELIVDNFAGGGGASTGIEIAIGRSVDIAINHDPIAIAMHRTNHPTTKHYIEDVWKVDPLEATGGRPVALAWFSPDCKHFSKAKGGKPVDKNIRGLAWVAVKWAKLVRPRVIMLENVEEFKTWGPIIPKRDKITGRILKKVYRDENDDVAWDEVISEPGEVVPEELQILMPDPKRKGETFELFVKALEKQGYKVDFRELRACDYGAPTTRKRFFMVARCDGKPIVWPEPTHGDPEQLEVRCGILKPWRTAAECIDWSIPCPSIFDRNKPLAENTLKRIARGFQKFVIDNPSPFIVRIGQTGFAKDGLQYELNGPLTTITTKAEHCLITPYLATYYTETADNEVRGQALDEPIATIPTANRFGLVAAFISKYYAGTYEGAGSSLEEPLHTVTSKDHNALVTAFISRQFKSSIGHVLDEPLATTTTVNKSALVSAFLLKYYGADIGQRLNEPLHTITTKDRFGLVTIKGEDYRIIDIGMRMLQPHELFKAQGFPGTYIIDRDYTGKSYPKTAQVRNVGNSVSPVIPEVLVEANLPELCPGIEAERKII